MLPPKQDLFYRPIVAGAVLYTASSLIHSLTDSLFVKISLWRRHAPIVRNGAFNHKIDYITILQEILNVKGHQNWFIGSRVTAILLNQWIFPIGQSGEASWWTPCTAGKIFGNPRRLSVEVSVWLKIQRVEHTFQPFSKHRPSGPMLSLSQNVRLSVCSLLRYRLTVFVSPLPEVGCPIFLEIRNPWGKIMERSGLTFEHFVWKWSKIAAEKKVFFADFAGYNRLIPLICRL